MIPGVPKLGSQGQRIEKGSLQFMCPHFCIVRVFLLSYLLKNQNHMTMRKLWPYLVEFGLFMQYCDEWRKFTSVSQSVSQSVTHSVNSGGWCKFRTRCLNIIRTRF